MLQSLKDVQAKVEAGYRMEAPEDCPANVYSLMRLCWEQEPRRRPGFPKLREKLEREMGKRSPGLPAKSQEKLKSWCESWNPQLLTGVIASSYTEANATKAVFGFWLVPVVCEIILGWKSTEIPAEHEGAWKDKQKPSWHSQEMNFSAQKNLKMQKHSHMVGHMAPPPHAVAHHGVLCTPLRAPDTFPVFLFFHVWLFTAANRQTSNVHEHFHSCSGFGVNISSGICVFHLADKLLQNYQTSVVLWSMLCAFVF